ncbi:hypothetical protein ABS71_13170 [bacterium SCN 62-11]|nr:MAG: hypothetical protein ABS71_13170 [bacterium SCN 62-11]
MTLDLLREKVWGDPDFQGAYVSQELEGFSMAVHRESKSTVKFLCVDPESRRRGLGTALLETAEASLPSGPIRICESNPNYLVPGVDVRYTTGLLFLEKRGYRKVGETYNLHCDLRQAFPEESREGIRRARPEDRSTVLAFLDQHWVGWKYEVGRMFENDPISLHLAFQEDRLLGFSGYDGNNLGTGWFGPMGTDPEKRGAGVGGILLRRCLADLKAQGHEQAIIPWVGPYGFYNKQCGARIDRVFWRYQK